MPINLSDLDSKCKKTVEHFKKDLGRVRSGRAHTSLLDGLMVEYYGSMVPLLQLGMVNAPEARMLTIQVYDSGAVEAIEKAIQQSELGLNPGHDGNLIRISIPALTEERRKELVKRLHKMTEDTRVTLRNHRRDMNEELKKKEKSKEVSADELKKGLEEVQKITDRTIKEVDQVLASKEKELLDV